MLPEVCAEGKAEAATVRIEPTAEGL